MIFETIRAALFGRVTFRAEGGFPALFLEGCADRGAALTDAAKGENMIRAGVRERDFPLVSAAAEKAGMTLTVERRSGLPQLLYRYRARVGVPVGLALAGLILWGLSGMLWEVTVTGNERLSTFEILDAMEALDVKDAEAGAQELLPALSWIAVNIVGCKVTVEVREITQRESPEREGAFSNIVAARDGVIVRADVLAGVGQPKIGEAVVKGDLLVSGVVEMNNGCYRLTEAKAIIEALTKTELSAACAGSVTAEREIRRREVVCLRFFGWRVPFGAALTNAEREAEECCLQSHQTVFPIGLRRERYSVFAEQTVRLDARQAGLLCFADFCEQAAERYRDARVIARTVDFRCGDDGAALRAAYRCVENIARRVPLPLQDEG